MAHAVMHTTGQSFLMGFQAGGPHAQDRALEAIAYAYDEMSRVPERVDLGEAGQARAAAHREDVPRRPARRRSHHRLLDVSDLERVPGDVRQPGDRERGDRQAAPASGSAAGDHGREFCRACCAKAATIRRS
jgi:hypothetical protein